MEFEKPLGKSAIVHTVRFDYGSDEFLESAFLLEVGHAFAIESACGFIEVGNESEFVDILNQRGHVGTLCRNIGIAVNKAEERLEHARCSPGGRYEFTHVTAIGKELFPACDGFVLFLRGQHCDALTLTGGIFDFKIRESGFKALELRFNLRGVHTALFNVGKIFLA